jgi:hypothetical protein
MTFAYSSGVIPAAVVVRRDQADAAVAAGDDGAAVAQVKGGVHGPRIGAVGEVSSGNGAVAGVGVLVDALEGLPYDKVRSGNWRKECRRQQ